ncbi:MAG TPA: PmoA family protein [Pirellulales bacterium]
MRSHFAVACFSVAICGFLAGPRPLLADEVAVEKHDDGVRVTLGGKPFAEYLIHNGPKPIVWPIIGPGGHEMTRNYPMKLVEGEKRDHPHHRSLWFTHGSVNGIDFWTEVPGMGKEVHREYLKCEANGPAGVISTINDWIGPDGKKHCEDVRTLTFRGNDETRSIDFDIAIKASEGPVLFGDTKEGSMGLRVPTALDAAKLTGKRGEIVTSEGARDGAAWGKQAAWVDYHGSIGDDAVGIAILNHPSSFRFPTYWHVRDYGLFAANPFGLHDFHKSEDKHEGDYTLPAGETMTLRYRFVFHRGDEKGGKIAEAFQAYSKEPRP